VASLRAGHLVRTTGSGETVAIEPYHDRVREALIASLTNEQLRVYHDNLAESLEQVDTSRHPDVAYALAQHAYLGSLDKPEWVFEVNWTAGKLAADSYAFEQAYTYLAQAADVSRQAELKPNSDFDQLYANVSAMTGRVETAIVHCDRALARSQSSLQRSGLHLTMAGIFVGALDPRSALKEALAGLKELGHKVASSGLRRLLGALWAWKRGRAIEKDKARFGSAKGNQRENCEYQIVLHQQAALASYFALDPIGVVAHALYSYPAAALLGLCPGYVQLQVTLMAVASLRRMHSAERLCKRTEALAEQLDHLPTTARAKVYVAIAHHFLGHTREAHERAEAALSEYGRWLENYDFFTMIADMSWNLVMRGYPAQGWSWVQKGLQRAALCGESNVLIQGHTYRCYAAPLLAMQNRFELGMTHLDGFRETLRDEQTEDPWRWCQYLGHHALALVIDQRCDGSLDEVLARYNTLRVSPSRAPLQLSHIYVSRAYARLGQLKAATQEQRPKRVAQLKRALRALRKTMRHETLLAHRAVIEAEWLRYRGKLAPCKRRLQQAWQLAEQTDNRWVAAECSVIEARLAANANDKALQSGRLEQALSFFDEVGWTQRADRLRQQLGE
jgi:hypothetical protein